MLLTRLTCESDVGRSGRRRTLESVSDNREFFRGFLYVARLLRSQGEHMPPLERKFCKAPRLFQGVVPCISGKCLFLPCFTSLSQSHCPEHFKLPSVLSLYVKEMFTDIANFALNDCSLRSPFCFVYSRIKRVLGATFITLCICSSILS